jgi:hypothetical protein
MSLSPVLYGIRAEGEEEAPALAVPAARESDICSYKIAVSVTG